MSLLIPRQWQVAAESAEGETVGFLIVEDDFSQPAIVRTDATVDKGLADRIEVLATERGDGVVVLMCVARQIADRHVAVRVPLNLVAGKNAVGVAVDQQGQHHLRRILRRAAAATIDVEPPQPYAFDRLDKVRQTARQKLQGSYHRG